MPLTLEQSPGSVLPLLLLEQNPGAGAGLELSLPLSGGDLRSKRKKKVFPFLLRQRQAAPGCRAGLEVACEHGPLRRTPTSDEATHFGQARPRQKQGRSPVTWEHRQRRSAGAPSAPHSDHASPIPAHRSACCCFTSDSVGLTLLFLLLDQVCRHPVTELSPLPGSI